MKKRVIIAGIVIILGVVAYVKLGGVVGSVAEQKIVDFINENKNKSFSITKLEQHPLIEKATWTITDFSNNKQIDSQLLIKLVGKKENLLLLHSEIERGKTKFENESYGFGKITTRFDFSQIDGFPIDKIPNESFLLVNYVKLTGNNTAVATIAPLSHYEVKDDGSIVQFDFAGIKNVMSFSLMNPYQAIQGKLTINDMSVDGNDRNLFLSAFDMSYSSNNAQEFDAAISSINVKSTSDSETKSIVLEGTQITSAPLEIEGVSTALYSMNMVVEKIVSKVNDKDLLQLDQTMLSSQVTQAKDKSIEYVLNLSTNLKPELSKTLMQSKGFPVAPTQINFTYGFDKIEPRLINEAVAFRENIVKLTDDDSLVEQNIEKFSKVLMKSNAALTQSMNIKTTSGNISNTLSLQLSDTTKSKSLDEVRAGLSSMQSVLGLFDGVLTVDVDESLAKAFGLVQTIEMFTGAKPEKNVIKINAKIDNGQLNINGEPMAF